jgi:hypothetical protein
VPLDVDALTALSDLAAIAESGVDARSLDDVIVPAWVSVPYDEHLTQPLLRPEAPELATPPSPLPFPLADAGYAAPTHGLAALVDGEEVPEPLHLDRLPLDPQAPGAPEWPARLAAATSTGLGAARAAGARTAHLAGTAAARVRELGPADRVAVALAGSRPLVAEVAADLRDLTPRLVRLGAVAVGAGLLAGTLAPVLTPQGPGSLSALEVLASASPLSFDVDPAPLPASPSAPTGRAGEGTGTSAAAVAGSPGPAGTATQADPAAVPGPAEQGEGGGAGPLDVLRAALSFGSPAEGEERAVVASAGAAAALPARSGSGRRVVLGPQQAWAVAADGSVARTWPVARGTCPAAGTYRVRRGPAAADGVRAALWAARGRSGSQVVHGVATDATPCAAAAPADSRWLRSWTARGTVVVILA